MPIFSNPIDNSAVLQAIFDRDLHTVERLLPQSDCCEGNGRLLRTAVVYATPAIVDVVKSATPKKLYAYAVAEGLEKGKTETIQKLIGLSKFSNGAHNEIQLAFEKEQWHLLMDLLLHGNMKRDGAHWVGLIGKRTPTEVAARLERLMGARLCKKLPLSIWTLAGTNSEAFKIFAPHLNLPKMHALVLTKMYTRLTEDSQRLIEELLRQNGHMVAV